VAILPLLGSGLLRATIGCFIAFLWQAFVRESVPFVEASTNALLYVAAWQIFVTYFAALVIESDSLKVFNLHDFELGVLLIFVNLIIVLFVGGWGCMNVLKENEEMHWRKAKSSAEILLLNGVLRQDEHSSTNAGSARDVNLLLEKYLMDPKMVVMTTRIGAGSFGEVATKLEHLNSLFPTKYYMIGRLCFLCFGESCILISDIIFFFTSLFRAGFQRKMLWAASGN